MLSRVPPGVEQDTFAVQTAVEQCRLQGGALA
jgi:hypothetical protein